MGWLQPGTGQFATIGLDISVNFDPPHFLVQRPTPRFSRRPAEGGDVGWNHLLALGRSLCEPAPQEEKSYGPQREGSS